MELIVTQNITLDGVVEAIDGWFSPTGGDADTADEEAILGDAMARQDGLLLGRETFEQFRGYWPVQTDDTTGIRDHLDRVPKYVASRTLTEPGWERSTVLAGDLADEVRALKQRPGGELGVTGSIQVCHALITAGLVDEYRLFTYPVVLGRGRRLFPDGTRLDGLRLVEARALRSGCAYLVHRAR